MRLLVLLTSVKLIGVSDLFDKLIWISIVAKVANNKKNLISDNFVYELFANREYKKNV